MSNLSDVFTRLNRNIMDFMHTACVLLFVIPVYSTHGSRRISERNGLTVVECFVEFRLDLSEKPIQYHKASTMSSHHPQAPVLTIGMHQWIELECSCCCEQDKVKRAAARAASLMSIVGANDSPYKEPAQPPGQLQFQIISTNGHVALLTETKKTSVNARSQHTSGDEEDASYSAKCEENRPCTEMYKPVECTRENVNSSVSKSTHGFYVYGDNLGYSEIKAALLWVGKPQKDPKGSENTVEKVEAKSKMPSIPLQMDDHVRLLITDAHIFVTKKQLIADGKLQTGTTTKDMYNDSVDGHWERSIRVTIILRPQKFYMASDWSAAIIAFMFAISVGCCNDPVVCRAQLRQSKAILAAVGCQLIIVPMLTLGLSACFSLSVDQAFGLFVTSTVPGGGVAYLLTYLVNGNRQLSAALSLVIAWVDMITAPLWLNTMGLYWFDRPIHVWKATGWLSIIAMAQTLGTVIRGCRPSLAIAILTWITKPILLLSGILMVTLGVYINHYAFTEINPNLILSLLFVITLGFLTGWVAGRMLRENLQVTKTLANEAAVFNGLLCMPLLRTCLHAPEGDLTAVPPLWITFMTPVPLVYHAVLSVLQRWLAEYLQRRRKKAENAASAEFTSAPGTTVSEIGAASVAAVAAASIAVAPVITAGEKTKVDDKSAMPLLEDAKDAETNMDNLSPVAETKYYIANGRGTVNEYMAMGEYRERTEEDEGTNRIRASNQAEKYCLLELAPTNVFKRRKPFEELNSVSDHKRTQTVERNNIWLTGTIGDIKQLESKNTTELQSTEHGKMVKPMVTGQAQSTSKQQQPSPKPCSEIRRQTYIPQEELHKLMQYTNL
ncbi:unnamed protein product [Dicrocoelium dendriticum]|nr:unnamed protein product [Dicrocoelium dendriticum]